MKGFIAYPSKLREVVQTLSRLPEEIAKRTTSLTLDTWETNDIAGYCLVDPIIANIDSSDFIVADVTTANFNVFYEIGYAMGRRKRVILIRNAAIKSSEFLIRDVGVFETLGYKTYTNHADLCVVVCNLATVKPLSIPEGPKNGSLPLFIALPRDKTEAEIRILSRIKKQTRIGFRNFDPREQVRLSAIAAIENIASSHGVILPLISSNRVDFEAHNLRCAFLAGMAHALEIETLILQSGSEPVPLDYADAVSYYASLENIDKHINDFAPRVTESLQQIAQATFPQLLTPIQQLSLGASAAENEHSELGAYYIQTEEYQRVIRGEVQLVTGRKGSGKTALFYQVRNRIRQNKKNIVLDLNPEGFQLSKFKTVVLDRLDVGTQEHTITAFWEYLMLLELCYKLLEKDRVRHLHDHTLRSKYLDLQKIYKDDPFVTEGDFAERLLLLIESIESRFLKSESASRDQASSKDQTLLIRKRITEFLYQHDFGKLRDSVKDYLNAKEEVWILFDNIDKGWSAQGVSDTDLLNLRCLIECLRKLGREFRKSEISCRGVVFIRNDVYEVLLDSTPDRGKVARANLDWTDPDLMRELLRLRFVASLAESDVATKDHKIDFDSLWRSAAVTHLSNGEETSQYVVDRSLMRPRCLIDLVLQCKSHAVNLGHAKILEDDFYKGESAYSSDLVHHICLEMQDLLPGLDGALYAFFGCSKWTHAALLEERIERLSEGDRVRSMKIKELLLWYGVIGVVRGKSLEETYIYNVNYDMKRLLAVIDQEPLDDLTFCINPAFHKGLEVVS